MEEFLAERAPGVAFYSEDRGMVSPDGRDPEWVLVVDPIDGTRPAVAGLESCCVSVAAARLDGDPTMGDVRGRAACSRSRAGRRSSPSGAPAWIRRRRSRRTPPWSGCSGPTGCAGRPARALIEVLAALVDASSVGGASFDLGSATFDMTRIATGQLDAYIEPGPRIVDDVPGDAARSSSASAAAPSSTTPPTTSPRRSSASRRPARWSPTPYGESARRPPPARLLRTSSRCRASQPSNGELHAAICREVDAGIERLATARS